MPLPVPHPFGHVNLNVCPGRGPRPLAARPTGESLSQWGQVCICCSSAQGAGNSRPSPSPLTACQLSRLKRRPKENNKLCSTSREKKKQRKINERQKTKNSRNIFLRGERGTARATECAGNQYATKAICQRPRPNAHCAYLAHLLPAHWRCMHCGTVARWHGELSWTELWLSWIYGRRRTKVGNGNCLK